MTRAVWRIDEIEGEVAVVEVSGRRFDVPRAILPAGARADQCFRVEIEGDHAATTVRIALDAVTTASARERTAALLARLRRGERGG